MDLLPASSPADRLAAAAERLGNVFGDDETARVAARLEDDALIEALAEAAEARKALDLVTSVLTNEVGRRSGRERGYSGLAQRRGHRNATSLVQNITGQSRSDVGKAVKTGEELAAAAGLVPPDADAGAGGDAPGEGGAGGGAPGEGAPGSATADAAPAQPRWLAALRGALSARRIGEAQFRAIRTGLGEPPVERYPELDPDFLSEAWAAAVDALLEEARGLPVEELRASARIARDRLDPIGVTLRFEERFEARSFRTWTDEHGQRLARIAFDDDAAAWVDSILQAALRPRRGPRFVGPDAAERTAEAKADERTNEQLQYDTILAVLRTGAAADPNQAFGDRQPGVRILIDADAIDRIDQPGGARVTGVGHLEDGGQAVPAGVVETYLCDAGSLPIIRDDHGRPLDLGREQRLFSRKQRIAIAARDGGCLWPACTAPVSQCEYHHVDHWWDDHGKTNVDDGVPLCRNCHLRLHNQGWRIARERDPGTGDDTYWLHGPPDLGSGEVPPRVAMPSKSPRRFAVA